MQPIAKIRYNELRRWRIDTATARQQTTSVWRDETRNPVILHTSRDRWQRWEPTDRTTASKHVWKRPVEVIRPDSCVRSCQRDRVLIIHCKLASDRVFDVVFCLFFIYLLNLFALTFFQWIRRSFRTEVRMRCNTSRQLVRFFCISNPSSFLISST